MANRSLWISSVFLTILFFFLSAPCYHSDAIFNVRSKDSSGRRVLLLTAHPDDECMFFAPTVLALTHHSPAKAGDLQGSIHKSKRHTELYSLCLSSGNADGLGDTRKRELNGSLDVLGIEPGRRWVFDRPFQDNITAFWDAQLIADQVRPYIEKNKIDVILTFDEYGISSHPNHISLEYGVRTLLKGLSKDVLRAFSLKTTALLPKYTGAAAALFSKLEESLCTVFPNLRFYGNFPMQYLPPLLKTIQITDCAKYDDSSPEGSSHALFVSGWSEYLTALRAMQEHHSQLVWFRWLYVTFSRYMWVNEWKEIVIE